MGSYRIEAVDHMNQRILDEWESDDRTLPNAVLYETKDQYWLHTHMDSERMRREFDQVQRRRENEFECEKEIETKCSECHPCASLDENVTKLVDFERSRFLRE